MKQFRRIEKEQYDSGTADSIREMLLYLFLTQEQREAFLSS